MALRLGIGCNTPIVKIRSGFARVSSNLTLLSLFFFYMGAAYSSHSIVLLFTHSLTHSLTPLTFISFPCPHSPQLQRFSSIISLLPLRLHCPIMLLTPSPESLLQLVPLPLKPTRNILTRQYLLQYSLLPLAVR